MPYFIEGFFKGLAKGLSDNSNPSETSKKKEILVSRGEVFKGYLNRGNPDFLVGIYKDGNVFSKSDNALIGTYSSGNIYRGSEADLSNIVGRFDGYRIYWGNNTDLDFCVGNANNGVIYSGIASGNPFEFGRAEYTGDEEGASATAILTGIFSEPPIVDFYRRNPR